MNLQKILVFIFFILLLIIAGEAAIYLYHPSSPSGTNTFPALTSTNTIIITPTPVPNAALDQGILNDLLLTSKNIKRDVLKSYVITVVLEGRIKDLLIPTDNTSPYSNKIFHLYLVGPEGGTHELGMPKNSSLETHNLKVYNEKNEPISINDLKNGDNVRFEIQMDITHSSPNDFHLVYNWQFNKI